MCDDIRRPEALLVLSWLLLLGSASLPWMGVPTEPERIPSIGSYALGYGIGLIELLFLGAVGVVMLLLRAVPARTLRGSLLGLLGIGYAILPSYLVADLSRSLPEPFEPTVLGPAMASLAGCVAIAAGMLMVAGADSEQ